MGVVVCVRLQRAAMEENTECFLFVLFLRFILVVCNDSVSVRIIATSWGAHIIANPCSQQNSVR